MKTLQVASLTIALAGLSSAYPSILAELEAQKNPAKRQLSDLVPPPFDAASQLVDVTGDHTFNPPGPGDQRGPCPGRIMALQKFIEVRKADFSRSECTRQPWISPT